MYSKELYVSRLRIIVKVKVTQLCLTLYNPTDSSSQTPLYGILQARILEKVAISFSRGSSQPRD